MHKYIDLYCCNWWVGAWDDESAHEIEVWNQKLMIRRVALMELMSWVNEWNQKLSQGVESRRWDWVNVSWVNESWVIESWVNESWVNESWVNESWVNEIWVNESWISEWESGGGVGVGVFFRKQGSNLLSRGGENDWLADWLAHWVAGWRPGWLCGWWADWLAHCVAGSLAGWLAGSLSMRIQMFMTQHRSPILWVTILNLYKDNKEIKC